MGFARLKSSAVRSTEELEVRFRLVRVRDLYDAVFLLSLRNPLLDGADIPRLQADRRVKTSESTYEGRREIAEYVGLSRCERGRRRLPVPVAWGRGGAGVHVVTVASRTTVSLPANSTSMPSRNRMPGVTAAMVTPRVMRRFRRDGRGDVRGSRSRGRKSPVARRGLPESGRTESPRTVAAGSDATDARVRSPVEFAASKQSLTELYTDPF